MACSEQEKHPQRANISPLPAVKQPVAVQPPQPASAIPLPSPPPSPPRAEVIQFIPPIIEDEPDQPPLQDVVYNVSDNDVQTDMDMTPVPPSPPKQEEPLSFVEEIPEYPGGMAALRKYFTDNLAYPASAKEAGIEGKCYLQFVVSKTGEISNVKVLRGVPDCKECNEEAERLVKAMPKWKPGKQNGKAVDCFFHLPVAFKLQ